MTYTIEFSRPAERQFRRLARPLQARLKTKIDALAQNPRPHGIKKLEGEHELYRLRVGDYRLIYQMRDNDLIVLIVKLGDRKEVYRKHK